MGVANARTPTTAEKAYQPRHKKTDPSYSTIEKIAKAMDCTLSELFNHNEEEFKEIHVMDKSLMEKVSILDNLEEKEKLGIYAIIDGLATKQKLKQTLTNALLL